MPRVRLVSNPKKRHNAGALTYVKNPRHVRRYKARSNKKRYVHRTMNPRGHVVYRYRRNPEIMRSFVEPALYATLGGVLTRSIPASVMSDATNAGITGYAANAGVALGLGFAVSKIAGQEPGKWTTIGGLVMLGGRIASDFLGQQIVQFGSYKLPIPKLSGDHAFNFSAGLRGVYAPRYDFPIPMNSAPADARFNYPPALPAAADAPPAQAPAAPQPTAMGNTPGLWAGAWNR